MPQIELRDLFDIIENANNSLFTGSTEYRNCKSKMMAGAYNLISKKEYKEFAGAVKMAESQYNRAGLKDIAYILRRLLYHAEELGYPEIAQLKKKYKWAFI